MKLSNLISAIQIRSADLRARVFGRDDLCPKCAKARLKSPRFSRVLERLVRACPVCRYEMVLRCADARPAYLRRVR